MIGTEARPRAHKSFAVGGPPRVRPRLIPARRAYKSWVADDTIEDYALRFTPPSARRFGLFGLADTAFGATSFMALEVIGALLTLADGTRVAIAAIVAVACLLFGLGLPITLAAARRGIDIDLLTRGAGFGYLGSTATSLIYATFTFLFFAFEASILAESLRQTLGWPLVAGEVAGAAVVVPLVMRGVTFISRFQRLTQPVWLLLTVLPVAAFLHDGGGRVHAWLAHPGLAPHVPFVLAFGSAASIVVSLAPQIGEQVDYLRFLPERTRNNQLGWWGALLVGGPGWVVPGVLKMLIGSALATLALGDGAAGPAQPATMYGHAFALLAPGHGRLASSLALVLIVVAQLKINVTNAYSGSIAWSNFFSRLTRNYPGRAVWVLFNVGVALLLMLLGVYPAIETVLVCFSVVACAWLGALFADLAIARPLGLAPRTLDHKRAHLHDINPVGVGAMLAATASGLASLAGMFGPLPQAYAPFVALATSLASVPALAMVTGGRFYLARKGRRGWREAAPSCVVCGNTYAPDDSAYCPAYRGAICSLCCTLDLRCQDACRPHARAGAGIERLLARFATRSGDAARPAVRGLAVLRFAVRFALASGLLASLLATIAFAASRAGDPARDLRLDHALEHVFLVLVILAGVVVWLFTLTEESRRAAIEENDRQTLALEEEIARRARTDAELTRARQAAESANHAKSRFIVGVAHELRTPLNAVLGYAQLLELDEGLGAGRRDRVRAIRLGGEHLARLIEGLLDISKIEAGRIEIERRPVALAGFLGAIADMFRLQAESRGIGFRFEAAPNLPAVVSIDETRLRQVLINLLSNALKFTQAGAIGLRVTKAGEVTEFAVHDTGPGIREADLPRIFDPFERASASAAVPGIGLGLTITRLLVAIMGGEITVDTALARGSAFRVRLLLSEPANAASASIAGHFAGAIRGYRGERCTLLAADDDATQRALLADSLLPLGFTLLAVPDGESLLGLAREARQQGRKVDAVLLDISMPGPERAAPDGWTVARSLRAEGFEAPIIVVSAHPEPSADAPLHDAFLAKPMNIAELRETLGRVLDLEWIRDEVPANAGPAPPEISHALAGSRAHLRALARIGDVRALQDEIGRLLSSDPANRTLAALQEAARRFRLDQVDRVIDTLDVD